MASRDTKSQHEHQKKYFDREMKAFSEYDLLPWQKSYIGRMKESFFDGSYKGKVLADVGCGSGYIAVEMAKMGAKVYAIDISEQAIDNLNKFKKEKKLRTLNTVLSPVEKIKLPTASVDFLVANAILEHIVEEKKTVAEWKRILKPGGRIFITVPIKFRYIWPFFWPVNYIHDKRIGHQRRYDRDDLQKKFGMKVKNVYYTGHLLKVVWVLTSFFVKSRKMDEIMERVDELFIGIPWGASNISVVLEMKN